MWQQTWLVPFIYLAIVMAVYLFAPTGRRPQVQAHLRRDPNFYMILDIILVAVAIPATLLWRQHFLDYAAWGLLVVFAVISIPRILAAKLPTTPTREAGPLESAGKR